MPNSQPPPVVIVQADTFMYQQLQQLATSQRLVFFAGLPGTGKSLLSQQLTHLAVAAGRTVHLLQWDVARPAFEAHPYGQRYPMVDGVTHGIIRIAVGRWARHTLAQWHRRFPSAQHLLIGETPFIGHRFIELARPGEDATEELLHNAAVFVIPVPSPQVRHYIETERLRRNSNPLHPQESEDAPPQVLHTLWQELVRIASHLRMAAPASAQPVPYEPELYQCVYEGLLRHRRVQVLPVNTLLPTTTLSVYQFTVERFLLTPTSEEVVRFIQEVEQHYPDATVLQRAIEHWYLL